MRILKTSMSCLALFAGLAAVSIPLGSAFAAPVAAQPVCAMRPDGPKYYLSAKAAKADGARVMHPGDCDTIVCMGWQPKAALAIGIIPSTPMCGVDPLTHARMTYPNNCAIEAAAATWIHAGPCK